MLLAVDIGNTNTKFGIYEADKLRNRFSIKTDRAATADELFQIIARETVVADVSAIYISSVVRELQTSYSELSEMIPGCDVAFANHKSDFGFENAYVPPESCGIDRLVAAFSAKEAYGLPIIICDFGTATTIDYLDSTSVYRGGIISPGIDTLGSALFQNTSQLPKIETELPIRVIGNTTRDAIRSGIYFGYVGLVDGLIERMIAEIKDSPQIVATGGFAEIIEKHSRFVSIIKPDLVLDGLNLLYLQRNK